MYKKLFFILVFLTSCATDITNGALSSTPPPTTNSFTAKSEIIYGEQVTVETHFTNVSIVEFSLPSFGRGSGGAIAEYENNVLVATASGEFIEIDMLDENITTSRFPRLNMGDSEFGKSKRITFSETLPRVHDLLVKGKEVYVSYDRFDSSVDGIRFVISQLDRSGYWTDIYMSPVLESPDYTLGSGGAMTFSPSLDSIYFSVGDFSLDRERGLDSDFAPQSDNLPWGHILRINLKSLRVEFVSKGHRNPLGLLFVDGQLLSSEMGPRGGDEINLIESGENYGWPYQSFGTRYGSFSRFEPPTNRNDQESFTDPIWTFLVSVAPSQMISSDLFGSITDGVLMGSLLAESLFSFQYANGRIQSMQQILTNSRIRDLLEIGDQILLLTDLGNIKIVTKA